MTDHGSLLVSGVNIQEIATSLTSIIQMLPPDMRERLHTIKKYYLGRYGIVDGLTKLNGQTVSQIFANYKPDAEPVDSGQIGDLRYELYDKETND